MHRVLLVAGLFLIMMVAGCGGGLIEGQAGMSEGGSSSEGTGGGLGESGSQGGEVGGSSGAGGSTSTGSGGESSGSSGGGTEGAAPYCGDGRVDVDWGEECDAGEAVSDGCVLCKRARRIFLTSALLRGGEIGGLAGADAQCQALALRAMQEVKGSPIVDPTNFKALLSTGSETIAERHFMGEGPYLLMNGSRVSRSFAGLFNTRTNNEPLERPINVDERGKGLHAPVWTGTDIDGSPYPGVDHCGDWQDVQGSANFGHSDEVDSGWIHLVNAYNPTGDCYGAKPIYCVEQR